MALNKAKLHHALVVLRRIKTWQLAGLLIVFIGLSVFLLRQNNLGMIERRNLVKSADEQNGNVQAALSELQKYVSTHMNTNLGKGVFLEYSYQRAYETALAQAASAINPNTAVYTEAERVCQQEYAQHGVFSRYIQCVQEKLKAAAPGVDPLAQVKPLPHELFTYNFVSPVWSADLTGLVLLTALLVAGLLLLRVVGFIALRLLLRAHKT